MAVYPPAPVNLAGSLNLYNAKAITGEETVDVLIRTKEAALRMVADEATKPTPQKWGTLLTHWVVPNSEAYNVWRRQDMDVESVEQLFNILISRKKVSSTLYTDTVYKHLVELAKPKSCDVHFIEIYEHHAKVFDEILGPCLATCLNKELDLADILTNDAFSSQRGQAVAAQIVARKEIQKGNILKKAKSDYVERNTRLELQALVLADPTLLDLLDRDQSPADASSSDLTNWFQSKILRGAPNGPHLISLKTNPNGASPLSKAPQLQTAGNATQAQHHGAHNSSQQNQAAGNTNGAKSKFQKTNHGNQLGNQPKSKVQKNTHAHQPGNQQNSQKAGRKYCHFCKVAWPQSKTCDTHYSVNCYRNPQGTRYDANKAAVPPTN